MGVRHDRISIVVLTCDRADELRRTLVHLLALPEQPAILVVDNASADGTAGMVDSEFPEVQLIVLNRNIGAAARNTGVQLVATEYVAFCDDDSWWRPGSLQTAADMLDAAPEVAALTARILLGPDQKEDPACTEMAASPLPSHGLPGPALLGFIACASVFRRSAYLDTGGYDEKFFVGGEEELLALDLLEKGWKIVYAPQLIVHHWPSPQRDNPGRQRIVLRNALWVAWLRLPLWLAWRQTWRICRSAVNVRVLTAALAAALQELPWICRRRRVVSRQVLALYRLLRF